MPNSQNRKAGTLLEVFPAQARRCPARSRHRRATRPVRGPAGLHACWHCPQLISRAAHWYPHERATHTSAHPDDRMQASSLSPCGSALFLHELVVLIPGRLRRAARGCVASGSGEGAHGPATASSTSRTLSARAETISVGEASVNSGTAGASVDVGAASAGPGVTGARVVASEVASVTSGSSLSCAWLWSLLSSVAVRLPSDTLRKNRGEVSGVGPREGSVASSTSTRVIQPIGHAIRPRTRRSTARCATSMTCTTLPARSSCTFGDEDSAPVLNTHGAVST
mmetsp:Transcript_55892/g.154782  ORF Transcript_55892/g.154782 Transcript_55892/m.154782 type:complete len:282 (+) Transcript_55892:313-1158(+)